MDQAFALDCVIDLPPILVRKNAVAALTVFWIDIGRHHKAAEHCLLAQDTLCLRWVQPAGLAPVILQTKLCREAPAFDFLAIRPCALPVLHPEPRLTRAASSPQTIPTTITISQDQIPDKT